MMLQNKTNEVMWKTKQYKWGKQMLLYWKDLQNYTDLKELAQRCKNKEQGKIINHAFRIWFNPTTQCIELHFRSTGSTLIASTNTNDETKLHVSDYDLCQSTKLKINQIYGVNIESVQRKKQLAYNPHYIYSHNRDKYIYIQGETTVKKGRVVKVDNFIELSIDDTWNNEYTKKSKNARAKITAIHKFLAYNETPEELKVISRPKYRYRPVMTQDQEDEIIKIIIEKDLDNITTEDIDRIRKLTYIDSGNKDLFNLRTIMQDIVNKNRYRYAEKAGKITEVSFENIVQ